MDNGHHHKMATKKDGAYHKMVTYGAGNNNKTLGGFKPSTMKAAE